MSGGQMANSADRGKMSIKVFIHSGEPAYPVIFQRTKVMINSYAEASQPER
jgi:hypothetical protein